MSEFLKNYTIERGPFEATWESLRTYQAPQWFRDAKLGIWAHWGPQSVPMYGDWYARQLYMEGHGQYLHHWRVYGHPSKNGWKDIVKLWKAEKFDPQALMKRYVAAGAKYFVAQAVHHDNFDNWNSAHNKWNAVKVGPLKDIVGLWRAAALKEGLRFGVTEHLAASFSWWRFNKGADKTGPYAGVPYDGNDPACQDLYHANKGEGDKWITDNVWFHEHWLKRIKDLVDKYQPDLLYSDSGVPWDTVGLSIVAHLYNLNARLHGGVNQAVYTQKDVKPEVHAIGVLDIERGQKDEATPFVWQTDTCVGGWFYNVGQVYKTPAHVIEMFVDIVAKNGCLLLNFPQKPDGTLDDENLHILKVMADWIKVNGEGIYGTRPWRVAMEGPSKTVSGHFKEEAVAWTTADFRFTSKGNAVYAFQMCYPERREAFIRNLGLAKGGKVAAAKVLGYAGSLVWRQLEDGLLVQLPEQKVCELVPCIKVELA
ncbi:MAG: alpha-L-fucosidase [Planctomycetota bacterium]|nr:alpha-L-fucosidase [Planctomycetota bacterium]